MTDQSTPNLFAQLRKRLVSNAPIVLFIVYTYGFLAWNHYLFKFGFFEYNFIQIRYLSAGVLMLVPILIVSAVCESFVNRLEGYKRIMVFACFGAIVGGWVGGLFVFFYKVPQYMGGGQPIPVAVLGTSSQIKFLGNFDIRLAKNAGQDSVQTDPVCLIYQNDQYVILFVASRLTLLRVDANGVASGLIDTRTISLPRTAFVGLQPMLQYKEQCAVAAAVTAGELLNI